VETGAQKPAFRAYAGTGVQLTGRFVRPRSLHTG